MLIQLSFSFSQQDRDLVDVVERLLTSQDLKLSNFDEWKSFVTPGAVRRGLGELLSVSTRDDIMRAEALVAVDACRH
jgi:hypothetical protein